jgi:hypothetical protein
MRPNRNEKQVSAQLADPSYLRVTHVEGFEVPTYDMVGLPLTRLVSAPTNPLPGV